MWSQPLLVPAKWGRTVILFHRKRARKKNQAKEEDPKEQDAEENAGAHPWFGTCPQEGLPHHGADSEVQEVPMRGKPDWLLWSWHPARLLIPLVPFPGGAEIQVRQPRK